MFIKSKLMFVVFASIIFGIAGCSPSKPEVDRTQERNRKVESSKTGKTYIAKRLSSSKNAFDRGFVGTWVVEGSTAEFTITLKNGLVIFSGRDMEDREHFQVHFIHWDDSTFKGSFLMPSTRHTTIVRLSVLDDNRLRCEYSGDASGESIWWRK